MCPRNILVIGTGAIGAFYASRLSTVSGTRVSAVCRSIYNAIKKNGIRVTSPVFGDTIFNPAFTFGSVVEARETKDRERLSWDYLIVTTKVLGNPSALAEGLVDDKSSIVVFQNGLGIEEPYRKRSSSSPIISAVTSLLEPLSHSPALAISSMPIGHELPSGRHCPNATTAEHESARSSTADFAALLRAASIPDVDVLSHTGMQFARWHETAINASINPTTVLADGCTTQATGLDPELYTHVAGVMREILDVAAKVLGATFPKTLPTIEAVLQGVKDDTSGSRPRMWHDWAAGRELELESIVRNVLWAGSSCGRRCS